MASGFPVPRSFRTEAYAGSHSEAFEAAERWLAHQPLTLVRSERISTELVPDE